MYFYHRNILKYLPVYEHFYSIFYTFIIFVFCFYYCCQLYLFNNACNSLLIVFLLLLLFSTVFLMSIKALGECFLYCLFSCIQ
jgi:hypothetical protein